MQNLADSDLIFINFQFQSKSKTIQELFSDCVFRQNQKVDIKRMIEPQTSKTFHKNSFLYKSSLNLKKRKTQKRKKSLDVIKIRNRKKTDKYKNYYSTDKLQKAKNGMTYLKKYVLNKNSQSQIYVKDFLKLLIYFKQKQKHFALFKSFDDFQQIKPFKILQQLLQVNFFDILINLSYFHSKKNELTGLENTHCPNIFFKFDFITQDFCTEYLQPISGTNQFYKRKRIEKSFVNFIKKYIIVCQLENQDKRINMRRLNTKERVFARLENQRKTIKIKQSVFGYQQSIKNKIDRKATHPSILQQKSILIRDMSKTQNQSKFENTSNLKLFKICSKKLLNQKLTAKKTKVIPQIEQVYKLPKTLSLNLNKSQNSMGNSKKKFRLSTIARKQQQEKIQNIKKVFTNTVSSIILFNNFQSLVKKKKLDRNNILSKFKIK